MPAPRVIRSEGCQPPRLCCSVEKGFLEVIMCGTQRAARRCSSKRLHQKTTQITTLKNYSSTPWLNASSGLLDCPQAVSVSPEAPSGTYQVEGFCVWSFPGTDGRFQRDLPKTLINILKVFVFGTFLEPTVGSSGTYQKLQYFE